MERSDAPYIQSIEIANYEVLPFERGGYTQYTVRVVGRTRFMHRLSLGTDCFASFSFKSRYSCLRDFHNSLCYSSPSSQIPQFPPKKYLMNKTPNFLEDRLTKLNQYFQEVLNISQLNPSEQLMKFVSPDKNTQLGVVGCPFSGKEDVVNLFMVKEPFDMRSDSTASDEEEKLVTMSGDVLLRNTIDIVVKEKLFRISSLEVKNIRHGDSDVDDFIKEKDGVLFLYAGDNSESAQVAKNYFEKHRVKKPCLLYNSRKLNTPQQVFVAFKALLELTTLL
mmetsp:Transcript_6245/g.9262  ORF Transcript_6245/g.9262 Transcript_6245/m.9262 type:complete len:278 (-) Transcript_6245:32-865(-)